MGEEALQKRPSGKLLKGWGTCGLDRHGGRLYAASKTAHAKCAHRLQVCCEGRCTPCLHVDLQALQRHDPGVSPASMTDSCRTTHTSTSHSLDSML